ASADARAPTDVGGLARTPRDVDDGSPTPEFRSRLRERLLREASCRAGDMTGWRRGGGDGA
ncbi:MAG: hypothetical protein ACRDUY_05515, partial [Nitriliruptorales bacterium]